MKTIILASAAALAALPALAQSSGEPIGVTRAVKIAEDATGGAQVLDADLDERGRRLVYDVDLVKDGREIEIAVDAMTGAIVSRRTPRLGKLLSDGVDKDERLALKGARPLSQSLTALEAETGGRVIDVGFDVEAGQARYEVEISTKAGVADVYLDPATGERLQVYAD